MPFPPTILIIHPKEKRAKCSLEPLRGRADLRFVPYAAKQPLELPGYIRLSVDGAPLTVADAGHGVLLIDGSWRHAGRMHAHFAGVPPRSLAGFSTAYPRVSKTFADPAGGLASLEALYIAYRILGRPTAGLLDAYRWRDEFLRRNGWELTSSAPRG